MIQVGSNEYRFGGGTTITTKSLFANTGAVSNFPGIRYVQPTVNAWQFSNLGVTYLYVAGTVAPTITDQVIFGTTGGMDQTPKFAFNKANAYMTIGSGTPPTATAVDTFAFYAKDWQGTAGKASPYWLTEDLKRLSGRDAANKEILFYKASGAGTHTDKYMQGLAVIEGESISDSILSYQWSTALDNGAFSFTAHASLAAMQTWINGNVSGSKFTGTKWIIRLASSNKAGRNPDPASASLSIIREQ